MKLIFKKSLKISIKKVPKSQKKLLKFELKKKIYKLFKIDLQNAIKVKNEAKKLSMNKLEELIRAELSPKDEKMDYSKLPYDELFQMCKERKIKYYGKSIEKQEMIHLLTEFDKDLPILDYPKMNCKQLKKICRERKIFYPDNIKKQEIIQLINQNYEDTLKIKQKIKKR